MIPQKFREAFERMRISNLGIQFDRRELGLLAIKYGIYFNSTMWACGLDSLFNKSRIGPKYIYSFKNKESSIEEFEWLLRAINAYKHDTDRIINHARAILQRYGVR